MKSSAPAHSLIYSVFYMGQSALSCTFRHKCQWKNQGKKMNDGEEMSFPWVAVIGTITQGSLLASALPPLTASRHPLSSFM